MNIGNISDNQINIETELHSQAIYNFEELNTNDNDVEIACILDSKEECIDFMEEAKENNLYSEVAKYQKLINKIDVEIEDLKNANKF